MKFDRMFWLQALISTLIWFGIFALVDGISKGLIFASIAYGIVSTIVQRAIERYFARRKAKKKDVG